MAQFQVSRSTTGTNMPSGGTSSGPLTDTFSSNVTPVSGTITNLGTTLQQIVSSTANTTGAGLLEIFIPTPGGSGGPALVVGSTSTVANAVNLGSGRTWYSIGFTQGASNVYIGASTGTLASVYWEIK